MKIGTIQCYSKDCIVNLREKIKNLTELLEFETIQTKRIASTFSELCRRLHRENNNLNIEVYIQTKRLDRVLTIKVESKDVDVDLLFLYDFFKRLSIVKNRNSLTVTLQLVIEKVELLGNKDLMNQLIDEFETPTQEQLLRQLKINNDILSTQSLQLQDAIDTAEQATIAKSNFLANMSHEIRTPMNAIIGLTSLLEKTELSDKQTDYVVKTNRAAKNLLGVINDILDFSKIEAGKLTIERIEFNIDDILDSLVSVSGMKAFEKGIELVVSKVFQLPTLLYGDPLRIGQVLLNLVNNSIKFTTEGEVLLKVEELEKTDTQVKVLFSVNDTGIGMTEEQLGRMFKAFSQADTSITRKYGGTGLGLSISKNLVEKMGGHIWVKSEYGLGTTFGFELTFDIGTANEQKELVLPKSLEKIKALIVDDNNASREVISAYLSGFAITSVSCASGEEALEICDNTYDLIILDYKMPGMTGTETWIKLKDKLPTHTHVLLLTAYGKGDVLEEAKQVGIDTVLMKPITQSVLFNSILHNYGINIIASNQNKDLTYIEGFEQIRGAKILVAEDNEINQQVAKETLEQEGFFVSVVKNGKLAYDLIKEDSTFDLILMDLQMPIMGGFESTIAIRKAGIDVPIIALSADAMTEIVEKAHQIGMDDFVSKPIIIKELFTALVKWIKPGNRIVNKVTIEKIDDDLDIHNILTRFHVDEALLRVANVKSVYYNILEKYVNNYHSFMDRIENLLIDNSPDLKRELHTLKGVSGNIGAISTYNLTRTLEKAYKNNNDIKNMKVYNNLEQSLIEDIIQINCLLNQVLFDKNDDILSDEEALPLLDELILLLEEYETASDTVFKRLFGYLKDKGVKNLNLLETHINNYNFEEALKIVQDSKKMIEVGVK